MGLLDGGGFELNPQTMGLLGAASGLMQAAGPSRMPVSMFSALGQGLQGGMQGYGQGIQLQQLAERQKLLQLQAQMQMQKLAKDQQLQNIIMQKFGLAGNAPSAPQMPMGGGMPPSPMAAGRPAIEQRSLMPTDGGGEMGGADQAAGGAASLPPSVPDLQSLLRSAPKVGQAPQPQAGGNPASSFPLSLNDVVALKALGGPDMLDALKYATDGSKREAGATYRDPITGKETYYAKLGEGQERMADGSVRNAPGYVGAQAEAEGAKSSAVEGAKARLDLVDVYNPLTRQMEKVPRLQAAMGGGAGGGGAGGPVVAGPRPDDTAYANDIAKTASERYGALQAAGAGADGRIARLNQLDKLLENHDGGKLSQTGLDIASAANSFGIKIDKNLPNKEAANALANEMALQLRNPAGGAGMPGAMSDSDRNFLASMTPGIANSAAGRKTMVQMQVALETRNKDVAGLARQWQQRFGRIDAPDAQGRTFQDQLQRWSSERPLFQSAQQ